MELIPILSTIILVATISTFILAVGAYILYKIREGKAQISPEQKPEYLEAEYFVPKEKSEKKIFIEEVLQPGTSGNKSTNRIDRLKHLDEVSKESRYKVVNNIEAESELNNVHGKKFESPKVKFSRYDLPVEENIPDEMKQGEIKWR